MKKGKVQIGEVGLKVIDWQDDAIIALLGKAMGEETYDVVISPKDPKGAPPLSEGEFFDIRPPQIESVIPSSGKPLGPIVIKGNFFGSKKGKVYLEYETGGVLKRKSCKVVSWTMEAGNGVSEIHFVVPKGFPPDSIT